ncbi:hypothetical protein DDE82_002464 [Stemphylium lycopersici]|nr:hypothetical protein TW65_97878 [Stemphylium lycopersici]RAR08132.1 hypothetical protein DDE82_002464 [Stemphylium lycopersici]
MHLQTDCSSCEHQSWESNWLSKLERAATFLARLSENGCSGTGEITALVQELNETYQKASWDVQHMTSFASKKSVARVNVTHHKTSPSPLSQEVRPEDVVELQREKQWEEIQDEDYDGNYVASTDPIHPVSTDYTHPWDNDDSSWVSNYFSPEEMQVPDDQPTIDLEASAWTWDTNGTEENPASTNATSQKIYPDDCSSQWRTTDTDTQLKAWAPEADATTSAGDITLNGNFTTTTTTTTAAAAKEKPEKEHMEKVMAEFWSVVNNTTPDVNPRQPTQHTGENPTTSLLENLHLSSLRPTTTTPPPLPPSPNSTRAT